MNKIINFFANFFKKKSEDNFIRVFFSLSEDEQLRILKENFQEIKIKYCLTIKKRSNNHEVLDLVDIVLLTRYPKKFRFEELMEFINSGNSIKHELSMSLVLNKYEKNIPYGILLEWCYEGHYTEISRIIMMENFGKKLKAETLIDFTKFTSDKVAELAEEKLWKKFPEEYKKEFGVKRYLSKKYF